MCIESKISVLFAIVLAILFVRSCMDDAHPEPTPFTGWNLNCEVKVKLTEKGYQALLDYYYENELMLKIFGQRDINYYKAKVDDEGFYRLRMWELIQKFGWLSHGVYDIDMFFSMEVQLLTKDLKPI